MTLLGVDVSEWQGRPDWHRVRASGVVFAIARVSFGATHNDRSYAYNRASIPKAGLVPGGYHFLTGAYPAAQADLFCANVDPAAIHVLDVEYAALDVQAWVARYRRHFPDHELLVYTGRDLWSRAVGSLNGSAVGPLWLAGYRPNAYTLAANVKTEQESGVSRDWHASVDMTPLWDTRMLAQVAGPVGAPGRVEPIGVKWAAAQRAGVTGYRFGGWTSWTIAQFSDHCAVPGISGGVDGDAFAGTIGQLRALADRGQEPSSLEDTEMRIIHPTDGNTAERMLWTGARLSAIPNAGTLNKLIRDGVKPLYLARPEVAILFGTLPLAAEWDPDNTLHAADWQPGATAPPAIA